MKTAKHTPGPWHVVDGSTVAGPAGNVVAECCGYSEKATDPVQRKQGARESNARLIAAAPELYDACRAFRKEWQDSEKREHVDWEVMCDVAADILAALDKAEGGKA